MRFTRGGKLMSRIKERVFLMLLLSIQRARSPSLLAKPTHTQRKRNVKRTHTSAVKSAHQEQERPARKKRKSVDDGGGGLTTRHQQQNKREEAEETSEKNDEIWLSYVAV